MAAAMLIVCSSTVLSAQVTSRFDIKEPAARGLQQKWMKELAAIGSEAQAHQFPYPFYFSRQLDVDELKQQKLAQDSIRFDKFNGQMVLEITGNYYAAYSDAVMDRSARLKQTYEDVVLPLVRIAEPKFPGDDSFAAFAIEVSHHVRRRVMGGVMSENAENVTFVVPRAAAHHLVTAATAEQAQAALLDSEIYVDAEPSQLWLTDSHSAEATADKKKSLKTVSTAENADPSQLAASDPPAPLVSARLLRPSSLPVRLITPDTLEKLKTAHQDAVARMVANLDPQAHFVPYAPPAFVGFHQGAYLQLSITSPIVAGAGSRYRLAALAFDDHIAHLVRPVLAYFQQDGGFDGISFSTTVKLPDGPAQAVEFFFPFQVIRCYANYDCTGQELIDAGIVLINGERASLNLQNAEMTSTK